MRVRPLAVCSVDDPGGRGGGEAVRGCSDGLLIRGTLISRAMAGDTEGADESSLTRGEDAQQAPSATEAAPCMPCRGSGSVVSNLGGKATNVSCPWCGGTGVRAPGVDAQQQWREREGASPTDAGAPDGDAA